MVYLILITEKKGKLLKRFEFFGNLWVIRKGSEINIGFNYTNIFYLHINTLYSVSIT